MNFRIKKILLLLSFFPLLIHAQVLKFEEPIKLGPEINSDSEEINPILSKDKNTLYFTRVLHPKNTGGKIAGSDIWFAKKDEAGQWKAATNEIQSWNTKGNNAVIGVNDENNIVYLLNSYNSKSGIAFSKFLNGQWTSPETILIPGLLKNDFVGYYMNPTFDVLLISMKGEDSYGLEDLYVSVKNSNGDWSKPINLGSTINTDGFEISPFLSSDGKKIYFSSNGHAGFGDADIFVSERLYENWNVWTTPKNLGKPLNSEKFDAYFYFVSDSLSFLSSNRNSNLTNIYSSKLRERSDQVLMDSVNQIVKETQKLLTEINQSNQLPDSFTERIAFPQGVTELSPAMKQQIDFFVTKYQSLAIREVIIATTYVSASDLAQTRTQNLINYLRMKKVKAEKISQRVVKSGNASPEGVFIIEFYLKKS